MEESITKGIPLGTIGSDKEKEELEVELKHYMEELKSLKNSNPLEDTLAQRKDELNKLDEVERNSQEEKDIWKRINQLTVKCELIQDNQYESRLIDLIIAKKLMLKEYQLRKEYPTREKFQSGLLRREPAAQKLFEYQQIRKNGIITKPQPIDVSGNVINRFIDEYKDSLVDITLSKEETTAIVPYNEADFTNYVKKAYNNFLGEVYGEIKDYIGDRKDNNHPVQKQQPEEKVKSHGLDLSRQTGEKPTADNLKSPSQGLEKE